MIKIKTLEVAGVEAALHGMRNPLNSWAKGDTEHHCPYGEPETPVCQKNCIENVCIGPNDKDLAMRLIKAGPEHRKFMRQIQVWFDITAPMYWWKEFDTYKVGTVANSTSTMHKIHAKEFTLDDFSHEHLLSTADETIPYDDNFVISDPDGYWYCGPKEHLGYTIDFLNMHRNIYINWDEMLSNNKIPAGVTKKDIWWQMIQLLPSSYNQTRTVSMNYETLYSIYHQRKGHRLTEWEDFREWCRSLPHSFLITGEEE